MWNVLLAVLSFFVMQCEQKKKHYTFLQENFSKSNYDTLWSSCSPLEFNFKNGIRHFKLGGEQYHLGEKIAEDRDSWTYVLKSSNSSEEPFQIQIGTGSDSRWAYDRLLFQSTLDILGIPTIPSTLVYWDFEGRREYALLRENKGRKIFDDGLVLETLKIYNFFSFSRQRVLMKLQIAGKIFSRLFNSGIPMEGLKIENLIWDEESDLFYILEGKILPSMPSNDYLPKEEFIKAMGTAKFYDPNERSSKDSIEFLKKRISQIFIKKEI